MAVRRTTDGYIGGIRLGGCIVTNQTYADNIVLLASTEEELQKLVNRLNVAGSEFGLMINVDKTVMALDGSQS